MRLSRGEHAPEFEWSDIDGTRISLAAFRGRRVMLSFYRYASCPFCNLRVHELGKRADAYREQGLEILAVFQSPAEKIREYVGKQNPPFPILPDPQRRLYRMYGVETSWFGMAKAFARKIPDVVRAMGKGYLPGSMEGEPHRLPADFIIGAGGEILAAYYGDDIGDHMPLAIIETYLELAVV